MNGKQKRAIARMAVTAALLIVLLFLPLEDLWRMIAFGVLYLFIGWDVLLSAVKNIFRGQIFDEVFLMAVAGVGAFCIGEYPESVAVMLFYQIGQFFESMAVDRSRRSIAELMDICPDTAVVLRDGEEREVDAEDVAVGETILVRPGERVALDGVVLSGETELDTMALTGESLPRRVRPGDEVPSGCVNMTGVLTLEAIRPFEESTASKILELVESSAENKAKSENFISRFAKYYTPIVVGCALILGVVVPLFAGDWSEWIERALIFLVTSCPCALVVSVPMTFFCGIGSASRRGVLVKGSNYLEILGRCTAVAFDKTGTLTQGRFSVTEIRTDGDREELLALAAAAESRSTHPIAQAIAAACPEARRLTPESVTETAGHGVTAVVDGETVLAGNRRLLEQQGIPCPAENGEDGTAVYVAKNGVYLGCILVADAEKPAAAEAVRDLKAAGIRNTVMLTGDRESVAKRVAADLGIDTVLAQLLPGDKVKKLEELMAAGETLAYVGDGINDAPAIRRADVGLAMGALGSDAAVEAADVVLTDDDIRKIPVAVRIARRTTRIVRENIVFALGVKFVVLVLGAAGLANMWLAVFADVGVLILAVLNAMRALKVK